VLDGLFSPIIIGRNNWTPTCLCLVLHSINLPRAADKSGAEKLIPTK